MTNGQRTADGKYVVGTIRVYQDDQVWERYSRWFMVPQSELNRLHVVTYTVTGDRDQADEWQIEMPRHIIAVEKQHPGAILVYCEPDEGWRERFKASEQRKRRAA